LQGLIIANAQVTARLSSVVSTEQYDLVHAANSELAFPLRQIMPIPVEGRVTVRQSLIVSVSSPLLTISNALLGVVLLIMMMSFGDVPHRDLRFWLNVLVESPAMLWVMSLAGVGIIGSASRWVHLVTNFNTGNGLGGMFLNVTNFAWIVRGPAVLSIVAIRALLSVRPGLHYRMAQMRMANAAIPTLVATVFLTTTAKQSSGRFSTNFSLIMVSGVLMASTCYVVNRLTRSILAATSDNFICQQVNRRIFTFLTYEGLGMTEMRVDDTGRRWRAFVMDAHWRGAASLLIDKSIWATPSALSIEDKGGLLWGLPERGAGAATVTAMAMAQPKDSGATHHPALSSVAPRGPAAADRAPIAARV
jgi:hypothetical protein